MAEQLPTIRITQNAITTEKKPSTLLGRGLAAIQSQKLTVIEQDKRYRQARSIYNRITDYGFESRFNSEAMPKRSGQIDLFEDNPLQPYFDMLKQLADIFIVFQQLADQGYGKAYFPLANMYEGGRGISQNIEKTMYYGSLAFDWCFANQSLNDPEVWKDLAGMFRYGRDVKEDEQQAVFLYRKAAEQGDTDAQNNLGLMYLYGQGVRQDYRQAMLCFRKAAEQGNVYAQTNLGVMYANGYGIEQDNEQAVFLYRNAAEQGYADAQNNLGEMYANGYGIEQDNEQAVFWYRKAAEQGQVNAQKNLASCGINWKDA
jgi:uncharacterized protein